MQTGEGESGEVSQESGDVVESFESNEEVQESKEDIGGGDEEEYDVLQETAAETVARVLEEQREANSEKEPKSDENKPDKQVKPDEQVKDLKPEELDKTNYAPARFDPAEKKMFENLPKGLKTALHKTITNLEGDYTRSKQETKALQDRYKSIDEVITPLAPQWAKRGVTVSQGINELVAAQISLTDPDVQNREKTFKELATACGVDHILGDSNTNVEGGNLANNPYVKNLEATIASMQEQINPVISEYTQQKNQYFTEQQNKAVSEMQAVRDEVDVSSGQLKYPELHDSNFLESVKPLVSTIRQASPEKPIGQALKEAWAIKTGKPLPRELPKGQSTSVPVSSDKIKQNAQRAAVSVRGTQVAPSNLSDVDIPEEALRSPEATARYALEQLRRRG